MTKTQRLSTLSLIIALFFLTTIAESQTITGAWKGKIGNSNVALKIVKSGDSLSGSSYYYTSNSNYRRYSIKGYFDPETNAVIWWDDYLIEDHSSRSINGPSAADAQLSVAEFNCPGNEVMMLDGNSNAKDNKKDNRKNLHLSKVATLPFPDEWDWVLENYFVGTNDPQIIDSINQLQGRPVYPEEKEIIVPPAPKPSVSVTEPVVAAPEKNIAASPSSSSTEKFNTRKNVLQTVIPITAETIELRFYDNAQVDGDSIALFLNGRLIFEHIRLTEQAYTIKIKASELAADNELVMVAENLGSIPPNTSFMVAIVGDKRYEARLFANEHSSAMVRLVRQQ